MKKGKKPEGKKGPVVSKHDVYSLQKEIKNGDMLFIFVLVFFIATVTCLILLYDYFEGYKVLLQSPPSVSLGIIWFSLKGKLRTRK